MARPLSQQLEYCPCGSGKAYVECCGRYHQHDAVATTAEQLMRSRYTAYVLADENYLLASWHSSTRPTSLKLNDEQTTKWLGLKVVQTRQGTANDTDGVVEFIARYKINGKAYKLHEISSFIKENGQWFYKGRLEE